MINLKNRREESLYPTIAGATVVLAPTASATLAPRWVSPKAGRFKALAIMLTTLGIIGDQTTKYSLKVQKRTITGAGATTVVSADVAVLDATLTPDLIYPIGTRIVIPGLSGNSLVQGEVLEASWTLVGTAGTPPAFTILQMIIEAASHIDASIA